MSYREILISLHRWSSVLLIKRAAHRPTLSAPRSESVFRIWWKYPSRSRRGVFHRRWNSSACRKTHLRLDPTVCYLCVLSVCVICVLSVCYLCVLSVCVICVCYLCVICVCYLCVICVCYLCVNAHVLQLSVCTGPIPFCSMLLVFLCKGIVVQINY